MGNLDNVLKKKIRSLGIARQVEAAGVVEAATAEIAKYIPREDFEVISFKNGVLKLGVASSATASELQLIKEKVIGALGREYEIRRIIYQNGMT